jgi:predicted RNA binding protein YcfA (HicA-like mRNA interferase family)
MKRPRLLHHLRDHGCTVVGEGGRHTKVLNPANRRRSVVPRHPEIPKELVRKICKQLDVPPPSGD